MQREKQRKKKIRIIITALSILAILAAIGAGSGYWVYYQNRVAYQREQQELRSTQRAAETLVAEISANRQRIERINTELQPLLEQVTDTAERMRIPLKPSSTKEKKDTTENNEDTTETDSEELRREGPEVDLVQEFVAKQQEIVALLGKAKQIEEAAQANQEVLSRTTDLRAGTRIHAEMQQLYQDASELVTHAQRTVQDLLRSGRRLAEIRQRFDEEERRREEAERARQLREEQRAAEERERQAQQAQTNREIRQLVSFEQGLRNQLDANAFTEAYNQMQTYVNEFTMEESIAAYGYALERYRYLARMKENIIAGIEAAPFPWGYGSGSTARDITGANIRGLRVQGAREPIPWSSVQPQQMLRLIDRYLDSRDISVRQRMEIAFGAAIYADLFGEAARERARAYAVRAMDLGLRRETFENVLESRWDDEDTDNPEDDAPDFLTRD